MRPNFIHAAFESFPMLPSIMDTIILPKPSISVLALVAYNLPTESLVEPLPNPFSYFTKEDPDSTNLASIQLLKLLPLLPLIILEKIIWQAGQAWLDGYKSIINAHTSHSKPRAFDCPNAKEPAHHTLHSTTLLVEDGDEGEAIDDEDTPQRMDDKLMNVIGEDNFDPDADVDLDVLELCWLTLHYRS